MRLGYKDKRVGSFRQTRVWVVYQNCALTTWMVRRIYINLAKWSFREILVNKTNKGGVSVGLKRRYMRGYYRAILGFVRVSYRMTVPNLI